MESLGSIISIHANIRSMGSHPEIEKTKIKYLLLNVEFADFWTSFRSFPLNGWPNHNIERREHFDTYLSYKTTKTKEKHEDKMII